MVRPARLAALALVGAAAVSASGSGAPALAGGTGRVQSEQIVTSVPTVEEVVGQRLVVSMDGTSPSASLLRRARRGRIGGVLIHGYNFDSAARLRAITSELQRAAANGGQPTLLIAVDQEGGAVKTVSWIPPTLSPPQMGRLGASATARRQGRKTGAALRDLGINTDFAPVADVPASTSSFMYEEGRTWSFSAKKTARLSNAFALGLADRHALATMKHFPGLGFATRNTDYYVVHITATRSQLAPGLKPYRRAVANDVPLIMLSNAVYDAYDRRHAAGWSRAIGTTLLRGELGFRGVTITDSLDGAANARGISTTRFAIQAARAGTDLLLLTGSEAASRGVYRALVDAVAAGRISQARLSASYQRIIDLKSVP
jgi:beta-N-acetylhexosaminidase